MAKRLSMVFVVVLLVTGALTIVPRGVASAATVHSRTAMLPVEQLAPDFCKSSYLEIYFASGGSAGFHCSGLYNINDSVDLIAANNWSGYVYINFGQGEFWEGYCDGNLISNPNGKPFDLISLYLSPTKEPWCQ